MSGGFRDEVRSLPDQFLWEPSPEGVLPGKGRLLIGGLGGSGLAGEFLGHRLGGNREVRLVRDTVLPPDARPDDVLLAISFSGRTVETLSLWREAADRGIRRGAVASGGALLEAAASESMPHTQVPGGLAPRSALGYLLRAGWSLAGDGDGADWKGVAAHLRSVVAAWVDPGADDTPGADRLVTALEHALPALLVAGPVGLSVGRRWAADLAENAKTPALIWDLPESAHNAVMAVARDARREIPIRVLALGEPGDPFALRHWNATLEVLADHGAPALRVDAEHPDPWVRALGLAHLGDWVSLLLAERSGVNPVSLSLMDDLKSLLSGKDDDA